MAAGVAATMSDAPTVRRVLAQAGLAPIDAQVLLGHVLGHDRAWLAAHPTDPLHATDVETFFRLARRRRDGEPVAYLTGEREFRSLSLAITPAVLVPRPETETLVECALRKLPAARPLRVLDLGTGSGAIALALARERFDAHVVATDVSPSALAIARSNAERLALRNVEFLHADWYDTPTDAGAAAVVPATVAADRDAEGLPLLRGPFDIVVSNPPYVAQGDPHLREGDVRHEPIAALVSGEDGLDALRIIVAGAPGRLTGGGALVVEHGYDQASAVRTLLEQAGFVDIESLRDLAGTPRVAAGRLR
jgi:release factor glutamine methyltransferase